MIPLPFALTEIVAGYGKNRVLKGIDLKLEPGTITGLLGRNGSGKTTMMHVALGLMKPTTGQAMVFEAPAWNSLSEVRKRIGFVPQDIRSFAPARVDDCLNLIGEHYATWDPELVNSLRTPTRLSLRFCDNMKAVVARSAR